MSPYRQNKRKIGKLIISYLIYFLPEYKGVQYTQGTDFRGL